eukprot:TRINITY_DN39986_c0_g1_i1.p1 TRINITY_DN39986_c0_g1~~TRINITY_DN39986_c0_g1_i1.p1  ORF type:complete len:555 (-),score=9.07 TRINITY_DN39986_c0_g1_i1:126-1790(-)
MRTPNCWIVRCTCTCVSKASSGDGPLSAPAPEVCPASVVPAERRMSTVIIDAYSDIVTCSDFQDSNLQDAQALLSICANHSNESWGWPFAEASATLCSLALNLARTSETLGKMLGAYQVMEPLGKLCSSPSEPIWEYEEHLLVSGVLDYPKVPEGQRVRLNISDEASDDVGAYEGSDYVGAYELPDYMGDYMGDLDPVNYYYDNDYQDDQWSDYYYYRVDDAERLAYYENWEAVDVEAAQRWISEMTAWFEKHADALVAVPALVKTTLLDYIFQLLPTMSSFAAQVHTMSRFLLEHNADIYEELQPPRENEMPPSLSRSFCLATTWEHEGALEWSLTQAERFGRKDLHECPRFDSFIAKLPSFLSSVKRIEEVYREVCETGQLHWNASCQEPDFRSLSVFQDKSLFHKVLDDVPLCSLPLLFHSWCLVSALARWCPQACDCVALDGLSNGLCKEDCRPERDSYRSKRPSNTFITKGLFDSSATQTGGRGFRCGDDENDPRPSVRNDVYCYGQRCFLMRRLLLGGSLLNPDIFDGEKGFSCEPEGGYPAQSSRAG